MLDCWWVGQDWIRSKQTKTIQRCGKAEGRNGTIKIYYYFIYLRREVSEKEGGEKREEDEGGKGKGYGLKRKGWCGSLVST